MAASIGRFFNTGPFFFSSRRRHTRCSRDWSSECALPISLVQMALATVLILSGNFQQLLSYFFFVVVLFIAMTVAGIFKLHARPHDGYRTWGYPWTPLFFLLVTAVVLMLIASQNPVQTALGVAVTLLGLPVYYLLFSRGKLTDGVDQDNSTR